MKRLSTLVALLLAATASFAQIPLQQSTASQAVKFGPFVDSTDGNTEETALTIANTDVKCSKNGGALASKNSGGGTHDANGWYTVTFDATDTNTVGRLQCFVHVAGALPVFREFFVYPTGTYAALFSTAPGSAGAVLVAGTNAATTFNGAAASGATPATAGLTITGGAASTTGGGVSAPAVALTGGAGAASTNGAAAGLTVTGGGTTTVSGGAGASFTGTGNLSGLLATGAGTGHGALFTSGSGATGDGFRVVSAATNGNGYSSAGAGTGSGDLMTGGATGHGANGVGGATSGSGFRAVATNGNSAGAVITGQGTGNGATITSGSGATGNGLQLTAASTNGNAIGVTATGSGLIFSTPANANVTQFGGSAGTFTSGIPSVNSTQWGGTAVGSATVRSDLINIGGAAVSTSTAQLGVNVVNAAGTAWGSGAITAASIANGAIDEATYAADTDPRFGKLTSGTAQAGSTGTTLVLASATDFTADNRIIGATCAITGGTGAGEQLTVSSYVNATDTATMSGTWPTTPDNTSTYTCYRTAPSSGGSGLDAAGVRSAIGLASANLDTQLSGIQSDTDNLQTRVPAALVSGRMDSSVGAYQTGLTPLQPTVSGRTLDVTATGEAGIDWANVGSPTTAVNLSGTTISTSQTVATLTNAPSDSSGTTTMLSRLSATRAGYLDNLSAGTVPTAAQNAAAVWDLSTTGHTTGGTFGAAMNAAGSAGDPWATSLPGAYSAGSAGYILGTNLNATVSSRLAPTTAGRTLDVTATGEAGIDWANIGSPTTTVNLSGTTISTGQAVASVSGAVGSVTGAVGSVTGNVGGNVTGSVGSVATGGITAASIAADAIGASELAADAVAEVQSGLATSSAVSSVDSKIGTPAGASVSADIAAVPDAVLNSVVEPNSSVTLKCVLAVTLSAEGGDVTTTGANSTYKDPSGTSTRITGTVSSNGNRAATITCPP